MSTINSFPSEINNHSNTQKIQRFLKQDYNENKALVKLTLHEKETQLHVKKNLLSPNWL